MNVDAFGNDFRPLYLSLYFSPPILRRIAERNRRKSISKIGGEAFASTIKDIGGNGRGLPTDCPGTDFIPLNCDIATALYWTGIDPFTKQEVYVAKGLKDRKMQRALMQFFKPENWFTVREALIQAGRQDLIGNGCDCLIPAQPPKEAIEARRRRANDPDHSYTVANPAKGEKPGDCGAGPPKPTGYRPGRKSQKRRKGKR